MLHNYVFYFNLCHVQCSFEEIIHAHHDHCVADNLHRNILFTNIVQNVLCKYLFSKLTLKIRLNMYNKRIMLVKGAML